MFSVCTASSNSPYMKAQSQPEVRTESHLRSLLDGPTALRMSMAFYIPRDVSKLLRASCGHLILQFFLLSFLVRLLLVPTSNATSGSHIVEHVPPMVTNAMGQQLLTWQIQLLVTQSCLTLCRLVDCSPPGSSVHGISQARMLEWVALPSPGGLPHPGTGLGPPALQVALLVVVVIMGFC